MTCAVSSSAGARRCRVSEAKFTDAETPGISLTARSTLFTQELHVIPEIENVKGIKTFSAIFH
jgi:hypothetical protein